MTGDQPDDDHAGHGRADAHDRGRQQPTIGADLRTVAAHGLLQLAGETPVRLGAEVGIVDADLSLHEPASIIHRSSLLGGISLCATRGGAQAGGRPFAYVTDLREEAPRCPLRSAGTWSFSPAIWSRRPSSVGLTSPPTIQCPPAASSPCPDKRPTEGLVRLTMYAATTERGVCGFTLPPPPRVTPRGINGGHTTGGLKLRAACSHASRI